MKNKSQIKVFKIYKYKNIEIIFRQVGKIVEYLFVRNGKIYNAYLDFSLKWWRRIFGKKECSDRELAGIIIYLKCMAEATIDMLENPEMKNKDYNKMVQKKLENLKK